LAAGSLTATAHSLARSEFGSEIEWGIDRGRNSSGDM
jgi:hypothetical protein